MANYAKVPYLIPNFSTGKITFHRFNVDSNGGESGIGYDMIVFRELMVQLGLNENFKCQVIKWYDAALPIKEGNSLLGKIYLTGCKTHKVAMQTSEPASTRGATDIMLKFYRHYILQYGI